MGTPLTDLLHNPATLGRVTHAITDIIAHSLRTHPCRHVTKAEVGRRFDICTKWFRQLRTDSQFSVDRCLSELPRALKCELDQVEYKVPKGSLWTPAGA